MNNRQLKKALLSFSNGHKLDDIAQFAGVDRKVLNKAFVELGVTDEYTALQQYQKIEVEEESKNLDGGKWDIGGKPEPEIKVKKDEKYAYKGEFNREEAVKRFEPEDVVPLAEQRRFRTEFSEYTWEVFSPKWTELLRISEEELKEQVKKFSPTKYAEKFKE